MKKSLLVTLLILLPLASPCFADTFQLTLKSGYNYISIPIGSSWNIKSILDQVSAATKQAAYWNPDTAGYIRYANDPAFDQFSTFEYAKGYWVLLNSSQNTTLILNGTTPTDYTLVLKKGWDAIGCPRNREIAVEDALAPLRMGVDYASVWRFNPLAGYEQYSASIKQFTTLKPGEGYWIRMSKDTSWHIVNRAPVLDTIGNKTVAENQKLEFVISATDPDNDPLTYSAT
ncbi:MAG: hypothetical protein NTY47_00860, partial [Candidatus Omnitrophica bacterium]|nr:hypothetical protein [Candidatus Omnitrophota bacterium]